MVRWIDRQVEWRVRQTDRHARDGWMDGQAARLINGQVVRLNGRTDRQL